VLWLIKDNGDYELIRKDNLQVPKGTYARDFLFKQNCMQLIKTNHDAELIVVESDDAKPLSLSYEEIKQEIRKKFTSHTVFPVVENVEYSCIPIGEVRFEEKWVIAITPDNKIFFFGDQPRVEMQAEMKSAMFACVPVWVKGTSKVVLLWIVVDECERQVFQDMVKSEEVVFEVRGMSVPVSMGRQQVQEWIVATKIKFEHEKYDDIHTIVKCVNSIKDVVLWRDYKTLQQVPDDVEAYLMHAALFFCCEGYATFNMLIIGGAGTGKTFCLDTYAYLMNTTVHAMEQSTLKGLVFSHSGEGDRGRGSEGKGFGQKGVLLREKYVALLNEFLRVVVRSQQRAAHKDEMSRLFASLNDAVERKKNRARSSGNVSDAEGFCTCSMMTTDNDYPQLIQPFAYTMFEDSSYLRRYSILRLSKETEERGKMAKVGIVNWKSSIDKYLLLKGLGHGRWARLMRFWRSQVSTCLASFDYLNIVRFAEVRKRTLIDKYMYGGRVPVSFGNQDDTSSMLHNILMQADFTQLAISCQASAIIMNSTFRASGRPVLERKYEDNVLAAKILMRLMDDMFKVIGPHMQKYIEQASVGVKRT